MFGEPVVSTLCWRLDNSNISRKLPRPFINAHLYFNGNVEVLAYNPWQPKELRFDPAMIVWLVMYSYPDQEPPYRFDAPRWRGFSRADNGQIIC